jgi:SH3-like domain-containing protein
VKYDDAEGYIAASVLAPQGPSGVMVASLATSYSVRIYSAPSRGAAVLGVIPPETVVDSSGCARRALRDWCRVTYNDASGYVRRSLLKRVNAVLGND